VLTTLGSAVAAQDLVVWGPMVGNSAWNRETFVEVAAGGGGAVARRSDGTVVSWGTNLDGECSVPAPPAGLGYVEVSGGIAFAVARLSDGNVVAWGRNDYGQCNVPA